MFKIEVVADTPAAMAEKLGALAEIYKLGTKYADAVCRQQGVNLDGSERRETTVEAEPMAEVKKPSGRKPKATLELVADKPAEAPKEEPLTIDVVRKAMMAYVDAFAASKPTDENAKRTAFKELLDGLKVSKLGELPEGQWPDMVALAKSKLESM